MWRRAHAGREAGDKLRYMRQIIHERRRNKMNRAIRRIQASGCKRRRGMRVVNRPRRAIEGLRQRLQGQSAIIIALAMLFIVLMVGLAIDGGASYSLRRQAQNASDGS